MKDLTPYETTILDESTKIVSAYFNVPIEQIRNLADHTDTTTLCRFTIYFFAHYKFKVPIKRIQRYFGHAQHGTIINGLNRISGFIKVDRVAANRAKEIEAYLNKLPTRVPGRQLNIPVT